MKEENSQNKNLHEIVNIPIINQLGEFIFQIAEKKNLLSKDTLCGFICCVASKEISNSLSNEEFQIQSLKTNLTDQKFVGKRLEAFIDNIIEKRKEYQNNNKLEFENEEVKNIHQHA